MGWENVQWFTWFIMSTGGGSCKYCSFIKHREFRTQLSDYYVLKKTLQYEFC